MRLVRSIAPEWSMSRSLTELRRDSLILLLRARNMSDLPLGPMAFVIDFDWTELGEVSLVDGLLCFPMVGRVPGIYRITLGSQACYIGETSSLQRRFGNYRRPGGSETTNRPRTNRRVNGKIKEQLAAGSVAVSVCTAATSTIDGVTNPLDLADKIVRLLLETTAIFLAEHSGLHLENLAARSRRVE